MTKDEALDLALAALECFDYPAHDDDVNKIQAAITAIKQARALDKKAENARELGLDYEPVALIDRLTNPEDHYEFTDPKKANAVLMSLCQEAADALAAPVQPMAHIVGEIDHTGKVWKPVQPAPVQPVAWVNHGENRITRATGWDGYGALYTTPPAQPAPVQEPVAQYSDIVSDGGLDPRNKFDIQPAAQRQWVGLTDEEIHTEWALTPQGDSEGLWLGRRVEAKLKEKNT
jgi:hypothetical protein